MFISRRLLATLKAAVINFVIHSYRANTLYPSPPATVKRTWQPPGSLLHWLGALSTS